MPPPRRKRTEWLQFGSGKTYAHRTHWPLQCLIFISPLLLFYQIAATIHPHIITPDQAPPQVIAFVLLLKFFALFGAAGNILPPLAVVAILLGWHLARKDKWELDPPLYAGMAAESLLWALPIFVIGLALVRHTGIVAADAAAPLAPSALPWQTEVVLSVGAGIYEELLFRLIAIILLNILFVDIFELKPAHAIPLILLISAILFSAYHYLGAEPFDAGTFLFRTAVGIYLAGIFIYRGFGIAVGAHALYDLIVVASTHLHH